MTKPVATISIRFLGINPIRKDAQDFYGEKYQSLFKNILKRPKQVKK
jgi:hypothetical protein